MITVNLNNPMEIRVIGIQALENALGHAGMIKFMQQNEPAFGDYTAEKYDMPDITKEEVSALFSHLK